MSVLTIEGFVVNAQVGTRRPHDRWGDIGRAFSGRMRSDTRATHRALQVQTVPLDADDATALELILMTPGRLLCGGDEVGDDTYFHARNVVRTPGSGSFASLAFELHETDDNVSVLLASFDPDAPGEYDFTRAAPGSYVSEAGVISSAGAHRPRWSWFDYDGDGELEIVYVHEASLTNLISTDDLTSWSASGSPVVTGSIDDPAGGTDAYTVEDDDGAAVEYISSAVTFTTDDTKSVVFIVRERTMPAAGTQRLQIVDTTAATARCTMDITAWTAGEPSVTAALGTLLGTRFVGNGYWAIYAQTTTVTAANTNVARIQPANTTAQTGEIDVYRVNAYDSTIPLFEILNAGITHAEETFSQDITFGPQALTVYVKFIETGEVSTSGDGLIHIGSTGFSTPSLSIFPSGGVWTANYRSGLEAIVWAKLPGASAPSWGDIVELLVTLDITRGAGQAIGIQQSINGATAASALDGSLTRYGAALFAESKWWIGSSGTVADSDVILPIITAKVFKGVKTFDQARDLARARLHARIDTTIDAPAVVERFAAADGVSTTAVSLTVA